MIVRINSAELDTINIAPATEAEEIAQNVAALALTPLGSCPILRGMGLEMTFKDRPAEFAADIYEAELDMAIDAWEPRAVLVKTEGEPDEEAGWLMENLEVEIDA